MGRLAIARGFPSSGASEGPVSFAIAEPAETPLAAAQARLEALERLTRLCEAGALTADEFLIEKAAILGHPRSDLMTPRGEGKSPISFVPAVARPPKRGKSLLGRLGWTILPLGLAGGLGLSALTQPEAAVQIWRESLRLFGL